jgi:ATP/maltotriose-dependent transcriptional regulator MalT
VGLALLHRNSEGWAAALQMAALSLRGTHDPAAVARAPEVRSHALAGYFAAALEVRAAQPAASRRRPVLAEPLTCAERRVLKLLPTSTYPQTAATLYISRNTVKTHLRSIYQKLGVASRPDAIERAADLRLL